VPRDITPNLDGEEELLGLGNVDKINAAIQREGGRRLSTLVRKAAESDYVPAEAQTRISNELGYWRVA
jgi:hypothetical protein